MIACDTSVLVAAFGRWHDSHRAAIAAVRRADTVIDHVAVETFSVLTRLPAPRRVPADLVTAFLEHHFPASTPRLPSPGSGEVLARARSSGVSGGAVYDLVVGMAAAARKATVLSLDRRAALTYEAAQVRFELLEPR